MPEREAAAAGEVDVARVIGKLAAHLLGGDELSATQIRAAEILLRRAQQAESARGPEREPVTEVRNVLVGPGR